MVAAMLLAAVMLLGCLDGCAQNAGGETETTDVSNELPDASTESLLRTDYYDYVNGSTVEAKEIPSDASFWSYFYDCRTNIEQEMTALMEEMTEKASTLESGSDEQKMTDFYLSALDTESRVKAELGPVQFYIDGIRAAASIDEYISAIVQIVKNVDCFSLTGLSCTIDPEDSMRYVLTVRSADTVLSREEYEDDTEVAPVYREYIANVLRYLGGDAENVQALAEKVYALQKELALGKLSTAEAFDLAKTTNFYTLEDLKAAFPNLRFGVQIAAEAYDKDFDRVLVQDVGGLETADALCIEENLETLKAYSCFILCNDWAQYADPELFGIYTDYNNAYNGIESKQTDKKTAINLVSENFEFEFGYLYGTHFLGVEARTQVENITREMIETYRARIDALDWMAEETKTEAKKKLDTMKIRIGYPDTWKRRTAEAVIVSPENGGSLIENKFALATAMKKATRAEFREPVDHTEWLMSPQTVNACYAAQDNSINFPAAILQAPFYIRDAGRAELLGGIGSIIGHELSHAFDISGSQYDEKGNYRNWWTAKDYEHFQELAQEVVDYYDAQIGFEDIHVDGDLTNVENIADISGVSVVLSLLGDCGQEDLRIFFEAYARVWADKRTDESRRNRLKTDVHSPGKVRTNAVVSLMDQFYEAYPEIVEGDAMYVAPEDRITIW